MAKRPTKTTKANTPSKGQAKAELGASSQFGLRHQLRADEFIPKLRGTQAMRTYREMRDNDPLIGAVLLALEMLIRGAELRFETPDDTPAAEEAAEWMEGVFDDMEGSLDDFLSEALSFLPFGFSLFEVVYKTRNGRSARDPGRHSKFDDGAWGVRKLAPRAQWTIEEFLFDDDDNVIGVRQMTSAKMGRVEIPVEKLVHFRTSSLNGDPSGRSVLRNAYTSYHYATHVEMIEAIAVERELTGIPVGRIPADYLSDSASADKIAFRDTFKKILRDVKFNEQGFILLPSDLQEKEDGTPTSHRMVDVELMSANGTRAIPTGDVVKRHQQNMARAMLADFLTLGQNERGSYALSKSKTDLFLAAALGFTEAMASTITRQIIEPLWALNGFDYDAMPKAAFSNIAPADLEELGAFIRNVAGAGMPIFPDEETENSIRDKVGWPERSDEALMGLPGPDDLAGGAGDDTMQEAETEED